MGQLLVNISGDNMYSIPALPLKDEETPAMRRKPREKKPRHKFSLLYTVPMNVLNESESFNGKKGKRQGFVIHDALVCKSCKPNRFFHARDALKLHSSEEHGSSTRSYAAPSLPKNRARRVSTRRSRTIECVDLDDDDDIEICEDDDEIEVLDGANLDTSIRSTFNNLNLSISKENEEDDGIEVLDTAGLDTSSIRSTLNSLNLSKSNEKDNSKDESGYGSDIECVDVVDDNENTKKNEDNPIDVQDLLEVTLEENRDKVVEVVLEDEVNAENNHIRNLLKEFGDSPLNKRKQAFIEPSPKKQCLDADDEKLLVEDVTDCLEVSMTETEDTELIIMDTFSLQDSCKEDAQNPLDVDDDIVVC